MSDSLWHVKLLDEQVQTAIRSLDEESKGSTSVNEALLEIMEQTYPLSLESVPNVLKRT